MTEGAAHRELLRAAKRVLAGLEARIEDSLETNKPTPVFYGIADLFGAVRRSEELFGTRRPRSRVTGGNGPKKVRPSKHH